MVNLIKMEKYQLLHNRVFGYSTTGMILLGIMTADTYVNEYLPNCGAAKSVTNIFDGMIYDSTFILIILNIVLALLMGRDFSWRTINQEVTAGHPRITVFFSKIFVYIIAFNLLAILFPLAGSIKEIILFGTGNFGATVLHILKGILCSLLLNTVEFLIPVFCSFCFRNTAKSVAITALISMTVSLYLAYGLPLGMPMRFLPIYQIREVFAHSLYLSFDSLLVGIVGSICLLGVSWATFCKCELK